MGMNAIVEKDRMQRERDNLLIALNLALCIEGGGWRAVKRENRWDYNTYSYRYKNGRKARVWGEAQRGLSTDVLLDVLRLRGLD